MSNHCWIVYLMPFANRENPAIPEYQQMCIKERIFGMGWPLEKSLMDRAAPNIDRQYMDAVHNEYEKVKPIQASLDNYLKISPGDYIVMRLRNGHFYIGRTINEAQYIHSSNSPFRELSWGCKVEQWYEEADESKVPSGLVGRFSQRRHPAIQRVADSHLCDLIVRFYNVEANNGQDMEPLMLTENNFVRSFDYRELEDLIYLHMYDKHHKEGYVMLPSSGKLNQQKYEFRLTPLFANEKDNLKDITCQVKSQASISVEDYFNEKHFRLIYLFSGVWDVEEIRERYQGKEGYENVIIVTPSDLFQTLKKYNFFNPHYYTIDK